MLSLSSSHPTTGAPWPHKSEVIAPQPILAGLGATAHSQSMAPDSPDDEEEDSDDQQDISFSSSYAPSSFGSQPAFPTQFSAPKPGDAFPAVAARQQQHASAGAHQRQQLPMLNTSFSLAPATSSHPAHTTSFAASPLDTATSLTSATSSMPLRGGLKPTGSLSFADSLSSWSLDCVGPPLDESAGLDESTEHQQGHSYRGPQFAGPSSWRDHSHQQYSNSPWPDPPVVVLPTPPPEPPPSRSRAAGDGQHQHYPDLAPPHAPALEEQQIDPSEAVWDQGKYLIDSLVEVSIIAINSIWPSDGSESKHDGSVLPLDFFIKEVINRSSAGTEVIQLALYYLHRARSGIRSRIQHYQKVKARFAELSAQHQKQQHATDYPSPPSSPLEEKFRHAGVEVLTASKDPVVCGRRMFLAALIVASKFLQDRTYSNRAWARLSGLTVQDVSLYERALLQLLEYRLFVSGELYENWGSRLSKLQEQKNISGPKPSKLSPLQKARSEYAPTSSAQGGLHSPAKPQFSPSPAHPQMRQLREEQRRVGRSNSNTDLTAHSTSKPNFFPAQSVPARPHVTRQRCDSTSSINARGAPAAGPYATPSMSSTSSGGSASAAKAAAASLRTASGPGQAPAALPPRSTTPLRPASRSGIRRPSSASGNQHHCKPLSSFTGERPHWLMGHHSASRQGFVH